MIDAPKTFTPTSEELHALRRVFDGAREYHGGAARLRSFLLAWHNGAEFYGFDFADLWSLDPDNLRDVMTLINMIARGPVGWYPAENGYGAQIQQLIETFKPKRRPRKRRA
jgi:hypothetical protein